MEEERLLTGKLYNPGNVELKKIKLKTHNLCTRYNQLFEDDTASRQSIIQDIFKQVDENAFFKDLSLSITVNTLKLVKSFLLILI